LLIIEDDLILAENLKENLVEMGYVPVGVASELAGAEQLMSLHAPDILIADIHLEGSDLNGIDIVRQINHEADRPVIYLTSYDDHVYRAQAKVTRPAAYLIKPANKKQIDVAIDFALSNHYAASNTSIATTHSLLYGNAAYFIKDGDKYIKLRAEDICVVQGSGSYTIIHTPYKNYTISGYLTKILDQMYISKLVRCHRTYAVNLNNIEAFTTDELIVSIGNELITLPLSASYKNEMLDILVKIKS
jgi:DNA-binding LytR/AlgR family response regulator